MTVKITITVANEKESNVILEQLQDAEENGYIDFTFNTEVATTSEEEVVLGASELSDMQNKSGMHK